VGDSSKHADHLEGSSTAKGGGGMDVAGAVHAGLSHVGARGGGARGAVLVPVGAIAELVVRRLVAPGEVLADHVVELLEAACLEELVDEGEF